MAVRAKTKRRLVILMVGTLVLIGGVVGVYAVRMKQVEQKTQQFLIEGTAHYEAGRYFEAMHALGSYILKRPNHWEVLYQYSQARLKVEEPGDRHVLHAISALTRVVDLNPDHPTARHELLDLYVRSRRLTEAGEAADAILKNEPDNPEALYAKALTMVRFNEEENALPILDRFRKAKPRDLEGNLLWLHIATKLEHNADEVIADTQTLAEAYPEDPRFELLMSKAHQYARNASAAREMAQTAASRKIDDPALLLNIVHQLDMLTLFEASNVLIEAQLDGDHEKPVIRLLAHRLWQYNRHAEVLKVLDEIEGGTQYGDSTLLALKALTLVQTGKRDEANPIVEALAVRPDDESAKTWSLVLREGIANTNVPTGTAIHLFRTATERVPSNAIFRFFLGRAYLAAGDSQLGHRELATTINTVPSWPEPMLVLGKSLLANRKFSEAHALARIGSVRWPRSVRIQSFRAQAWAAHAKAADLPTDNLSKLVAEIQKISPGDPRTLAIHVSLLAEAGRKEDAIVAVEAALDADPLPSPATLLKLIQASRSHGLGLADRCLALYREKIGDTPELALSDALQLASEDQVEAGLSRMDQGVAAADEAARAAWQLARVRFLERVEHDDAAKAWKALAESNPSNRQVQQMALSARSSWNDRAFIDTTIKRHRSLNAERSPIWRLARGKWWLTGPDARNHLDEAEALLLEALDVDQANIEVRLLLATCVEMKGNLDGAASHLSAALKNAPRSGALHLELARLRQAQGNFDDATVSINDAINTETLTKNQLRRAAGFVAQLGDLPRARDLLHESYDGEAAPPDMLLAGLYRRLRQPERVEAIMTRLLEDPTAAEIEFVANYYAATQRPSDATKVLNRLEDLELNAGLREMIIAKHAGRHDEAEAAVEGYRTAVAAAPNNPQAHLGLAYFLLRSGSISEAVQAIAMGAKAAPGDAGIQFVHQHTDLISIVETRSNLRSLAESLILEPDNRSAAVDAIRTLKPFALPVDDMSELTLALRRLSDSYPRFLALQNLTVRYFFLAGAIEDAITVADRTMTTFPNAVEPASLAAAALAQAGRWEEALARTEEWQRRTVGLNLESAVVKVHALLQTGDADEAVKQLAPYMDDAMKDPLTSARIIVPHVQALIAADRAEEAAEMVGPILPQSENWRSAWIWLAVFGGADEATGTLWLEMVSEAIPEDKLGERVVLAQGWQGMAELHEKEEYTERARATLVEIVKQEDTPANAHFVLAMLDDREGRKDVAALGYRKVLEMDSERAVAKNNLAMILLQQDSDPSEIVRLAQEAVTAELQNPNFRDTLAFALAKSGRSDLAVAELEEAIRVAPNNVVWQINLAWILSENGDIDRARQVMNKATEMSPDSEALPDIVRVRLDELRARLQVSPIQSAG